MSSLAVQVFSVIFFIFCWESNSSVQLMERCTTEPQTSTSWRSDAPSSCLMGVSHSGVPVDIQSTRVALRREAVDGSSAQSPRKTTTHSSMVAELDRFIRSAAVGPIAESLISPEGRNQQQSWSR